MASTKAANTPRLPTHRTFMAQDVLQETYDAIVVGSGATGGWAAKRLSEAGLKVALLEAGRGVTAREFTEHMPAFKLKTATTRLRCCERGLFRSSATRAWNTTTNGSWMIWRIHI